MSTSTESTPTVRAAVKIAPAADITPNGPASVWVRFERFADSVDTFRAFRDAGWILPRHPTVSGCFTAARTEAAFAKAGCF